MEWKKNTYPRNQIKKAGKVLAKGSADIVKEREALEILDTWRSAHAYPLQVVASNLRRKAKRKAKDIIVVQRLKRLDSIISKLKRAPWISLYDMQDLAGCRVIVPTVDDVYEIANEYRNSNIKHKYHHTDDYIKNPKESGYRGVHMIYRYHSNKNPDYEGYFVEIQYRTQLQHLWSTAVETMGIYTGTNLKAGEGPNHILRFFSLVSSVFAIKENCPIVPNTSSLESELIKEIKTLCEHENILNYLKAIRTATQVINERGINAEYYLLALDFSKHTLHISEYSNDEVETATAAYLDIESKVDPESINAVLVSADSISDLKYAYPNYFSDIGEFVKIIGDIVADD